MISITPAGIEHAEIIADVGQRSFYDAFSEHNSPDDMNKYLSEKFSTENIKKEILEPTAKFYIAYFENTPVGYLKLLAAEIPGEIKGKNPIEIQRIYVLKEYYDKKIGKELMLAAIDYASKNSFDSIWLGVWQLNIRAVEFYKKWGFEIFGSRNFKLGNDIKDDFLMIKPL